MDTFEIEQEELLTKNDIIEITKQYVEDSYGLSVGTVENTERALEYLADVLETLEVTKDNLIAE